MIIYRNYFLYKKIRIIYDKKNSLKYLEKKGRYDYFSIITRSLLPQVRVCNNFKHKKIFKFYIKNFKSLENYSVNKKIILKEEKSKLHFNLYLDKERVGSISLTKHFPVIRIISIFIDKKNCDQYKVLINEFCNYYKQKGYISVYFSSKNFKKIEQYLYNYKCVDEFYYLFISKKYKLASILKNFNYSIKYFFSKNKKLKPKKKYPVFINNKKILVEILKNKKQTNIGLAGRKDIKEGEGILIVYRDEGYYGDVMRKMKIPVDMIWINAKYQVVDYQANVKPSWMEFKYLTKEKNKYFLEIRAGLIDDINIKRGDYVDFKNIKNLIY